MTEGASAATTSPTAREEFRYGPSGARYLRTSTWQPPAGSLGGTATRRARTFHAGGFEETHVAAGDRTSVITRTRVTDNVVHVRERHRSGDQLAAGTEGFEYPHRDHLGSVEAVSAAGPVLALAYDPYGARRAADWSRALAAPESAALSDVQPRGFTGHEHLARVGLIHANGRLYDPRLGRYLSPDPAVSDPTSSQDWNGYSYVANSPLSFTDPTGMVRAGPGCNVGGVMCLDNGGGHADSPATYPEPYSVRVTIPVVTPFSVWGGGAFWGYGLPGESGYGWFGGYAVVHASIDVSGVVDHSTGVGTQGPGDRPMPLISPAEVAEAVSLALSTAPVLSTYQSVLELSIGYDPITAEQVSRIPAGVGLAASLVPTGKLLWRLAYNSLRKSWLRRQLLNDPDRAREIKRTLDDIESGGPFRYAEDGRPFRNQEGRLPKGVYTEYTVNTPGLSFRGARRIVRDESTGRTYYSDDHYLTFHEL